MGFRDGSKASPCLFARGGGEVALGTASWASAEFWISAASLRFWGGLAAGAPGPAFVEAEINILLELLELLLELAVLKLHLLDLAVDLPQLAFKAADPDEE